MSHSSFYNWKKKFGGMEVSDAKKLRSLEAERARLKRLVADLSLDVVMLKDLNSKNGEPCIAQTRSGPSR